MNDLQIFILAILGIISLNHMHRRINRARIIKRLTEEGMKAEDIKTVMEAYEGEDK